MLLDGLRQYLHRMVICLESELLTHVNAIVHKFLTVAATDFKALQDLLHLVQQLVCKFKAGIVQHIHPSIG